LKEISFWDKRLLNGYHVRTEIVGFDSVKNLNSQLHYYTIDTQMNSNNDLIKIVQKNGFKTLDDFIKANLHYLSESKQKLFQHISAIEKSLYKRKYSKEVSYGKG